MTTSTTSTTSLRTTPADAREEQDGGIEVPAGLRNVVAAHTAIGNVDGVRGRYHYRHYDATELARRCSLAEVWLLLWDGELPDPARRRAFEAELAAARHLDRPLLDALGAVSAGGGALLDQLRSALSLAGARHGATPLLDLDGPARRADALHLVAKVPALVGALYRLSQGLEPLDIPDRLDHTAAYGWASLGRELGPDERRALEQYLIATIDHGFNASTFTARVVASTGAGMAATLVAALGALSGPLHGGAPSRALEALDAIGEPEHAARYLDALLAEGGKLMGFGHAVYRAPDPRSALLQEIARRLGGARVQQAERIEAALLQALAARKPGASLPTNVEFYAGVVMERCGLPPELFTPTFAVSRAIGWAAHALEQAEAAKIIRPTARYVGRWPLEPVPARFGEG